MSALVSLVSWDHELSAHILRVQRAFLDELGIYYVLQASVGQDLWSSHEPRLRTYREFCELLADPVSSAWLDRLFLYYIETARCEKLERVRAAVDAPMISLGSSIAQCWEVAPSLSSCLPRQTH